MAQLIIKITTSPTSSSTSTIDHTWLIKKSSLRRLLRWPHTSTKKVVQTSIAEASLGIMQQWKQSHRQFIADSTWIRLRRESKPGARKVHSLISCRSYQLSKIKHLTIGSISTKTALKPLFHLWRSVRLWVTYWRLTVTDRQTLKRRYNASSQRCSA